MLGNLPRAAHSISLKCTRRLVLAIRPSPSRNAPGPRRNNVRSSSRVFPSYCSGRGQLRLFPFSFLHRMALEFPHFKCQPRPMLSCLNFPVFFQFSFLKNPQCAPSPFLISPTPEFSAFSQDAFLVLKDGARDPQRYLIEFPRLRLLCGPAHLTRGLSQGQRS